MWLICTSEHTQPNATQPNPTRPCDSVTSHHTSPVSSCAPWFHLPYHNVHRRSTLINESIACHQHTDLNVNRPHRQTDRRTQTHTHTHTHNRRRITTRSKSVTSDAFVVLVLNESCECDILVDYHVRIFVRLFCSAHNVTSLQRFTTYRQWLKCKIRGGGTLHSGLGPWQWSCAFP